MAGDTANSRALATFPPTTDDPEKSLLAGDDDDMEEVHIDIPEDAYGAAILALVRDLTLVSQGPTWGDELVRIKLLQAFFAGFLLIMNLVMQFSLLYFIYQFVVQPSVHKVQSEYYRFRANVFDHDGTFLEEVWDDYPGKEELCQLGMSNVLFYDIVILLWVLLIIREFRTTERLLRDICGMPGCSTRAEMCKETDDSVMVVALTPCIKALVIIIVVVPKFLICAALMTLGCQWLTATTSFTDLVMNSIAMEFVTEIDNSLFETLLPVSHRNQVAEINFVKYRKKPVGAGSRSKEFEGFLRSAVYLVIALAFVFSYYAVIQTVLPSNLTDLKELCVEQLSSAATPVCPGALPWSLHECFPYGGHEHDL